MKLRTPLLLLVKHLHSRGNMRGTAVAHSKVTAQGQTSVSTKVRKRLGVGPGSLLEWAEDPAAGGIVSRRG